MSTPIGFITIAKAYRLYACLVAKASQLPTNNHTHSNQLKGLCLKAQSLKKAKKNTTSSKFLAKKRVVPINQSIINTSSISHTISASESRFLVRNISPSYLSSIFRPPCC
ncbi:MAG: hypothetical protein H7068_05050 [Pedobacter sp.]|nr:hypothetical protein [Chitinophagaceae bacterium]